MALRSGGGKLSVDILAVHKNDEIMPTSSSFSRSNSVPPSIQEDYTAPLSTRPNRKKKKKKNEKRIPVSSPIAENSIINGDMDYTSNDARDKCTRRISNYTLVQTESSVVTIPEEAERDCTVCTVSGTSSEFGELRQRNVSSLINGGGDKTIMSFRIDESFDDRKNNDDDNVKEEVEAHDCALKESSSNHSIKMNGRELDNGESLDWQKLMDEDPIHTHLVEKSPMKYFKEEIHAGNSLRSTTTLGNEKERERVYDTIFHLPWRCELLIVVGFFVCLDSFLSLLTIMPTRIIITLWRLLRTRQFKMPSPAELSDFGCLAVLVSGVTILQHADISLIYHMIRGQGTFKLYVVYNVLEIFDKLCQSFGGDVMQALFHSADGLANCSPENMQFWLWRFIFDEALAVASSNILIMLYLSAITLSTCIVAHNNALFAMLVSSNFAEIKSNVFKRYSKDNVHSLVYFDSVERFHISAFVLFVLAQNILEADGPWFESFLFNAFVVYVCEVMIDIIKHSFIAKFNDIKPIAFSEFLEDLCKQTLNIQTENGKKNLTFVPLAPACVVIRVLRPVYAAHLPYSPLAWRLFWIFLLFAMTLVMLSSLKVMIGMVLKKHALWYVNRCQKRKLHPD
ncbi:Protein POLLEN DEFECTIVE IN GUIDANCE 1 [Forsythia ovata]|uniref:Protein POLLEN DEFECTIVE IN GUIDANCE 1 n=1 Tax=Forsythia ovata TaxID=205694 RepID=A0ABD1WAF8_9LAMI